MRIRMLLTPHRNTDWSLGTSTLTGTRPFTGSLRESFFRMHLVRSPVSLRDGLKRRTMEVRSESIKYSIIMCANLSI